jgi:hypothetical protein
MGKHPASAGKPEAFRYVLRRSRQPFAHVAVLTCYPDSAISLRLITSVFSFNLSPATAFIRSPRGIQDELRPIAILKSRRAFDGSVALTESFDNLF